VPITFVIALIVGCVACVTDIRSTRIPNVLTFGAAGAGLLFQTFAPGGAGFASALAGWLVGAAIFFIPFALRGIGAGDIKLMAALGTWIGPAAIFWTGLYAGAVGAVLALAVALSRGYLRTALSNVWLLLCHWSVVGVRPLPELSLETSRGPRLAFAVPIFVGLMVTVWLQ
jgi:prepilin peptidase CpaA